ncbi:cyclic nucleotide-binding domain-containing protein [Tumidithrix elongata RA019]|uniref:Cyclic nucleotide-binding domain-containing protein n=1 Tax=Tumidithrix elongata BACA0141 TaxID=2716417 RepID=A0AAW9Q0Y2_9CYAN|nr:cyclic nucleotide-binding domain-containing protein [Tumidithrix elongata RA019]
MAQSFHYFCVEPKTPIYQEGQTPTGVYLLKSGTVEIFRRSPIGKSLICYRNAGDLFGYTLVTKADTYQTSAIALTTSEIWFLPQAAFQALMVEYPSMQQVIHSLLSQDLNAYAARIAWEEARIQGLHSYKGFQLFLSRTPKKQTFS